MDKEKEAQIKYLEDLLDEYASAQSAKTAYSVIPCDHVQDRGLRGQCVKYWREECDRVRELIIRLFL